MALDDKRLRLALIVYSGMNRKKDLRTISPKDISFDLTELKNKLIPLLNKNDLKDIGFIQAWAKHLAEQCQQAFSRLLPLRDNEIEFLNRLLNNGEIEPSLICYDETLKENIKLHPALRWSVQNTKKKIGILE